MRIVNIVASVIQIILSLSCFYIAFTGRSLSPFQVAMGCGAAWLSLAGLNLD